MIFDLKSFDKSQIYHLMTQTVIPRPIAWILSENENKTWNLAPFSYFAAVGSEPPLLLVSQGRKAKDGAQKDTSTNLRNQKKCQVLIASFEQLNLVQKTAEPIDYGISEVEHAGLQLTTIDGMDFPIISGCKVAFQCSLFEEKNIGVQSLFFLEIEKIWSADECVEKDSKGRFVIDAKKIDPLSRLGAGFYGSLGEVSKPE